MDPEQTLLAAVDAAVHGEWDMANEHIKAYAEWRKKDGFSPVIKLNGKKWTGDTIRKIVENWVFLIRPNQGED